MKKSGPSDVRCVGVGIDTARYGHHVSFLRDDKRRAQPPVSIAESRSGYGRLQREFDRLQRRYPQAENLDKQAFRCLYPASRRPVALRGG